MSDSMLVISLIPGMDKLPVLCLVEEITEETCYVEFHANE